MTGVFLGWFFRGFLIGLLLLFLVLLILFFFGGFLIGFLVGLFPPQLGRILDWGEQSVPIEQGWAGNVKHKRYRDGIDRHFQEENDGR